MAGVGGGLFRSASALSLSRQPTVKGLALEDIAWPEKVPKWDPISAYADCYQCNSRRHKHNCRLCGHLFCRNCTDKIDGVPQRFRLKNKKGGKVRVCAKCLAGIVTTAKQKKHRAAIGPESPAAPNLVPRQGSLKPVERPSQSRSGSASGELLSTTGSVSSSIDTSMHVLPIVVVTPFSDQKETIPPPSAPPPTPDKKKFGIGFNKMSNMLGENMAMFAYLTRVKYPVPTVFDQPTFDSGCFMCKQKGTTFSLTQFLNHCRLCGHLFCGRCTNKFSIPRKYLAAQGAYSEESNEEMGRVCYGCEAKCRFGADLDIAANIRVGRMTAAPTIPDLVISVPKWANLALYKACSKCTKESRQGHNCRLCGNLFCDKCTSKMTVPSGYDKKNKKGDVRVCDRCRFLVLAGAQFTSATTPQETETAMMLGELGHMADELSREFLDKLRKAACVGCDTNFHMLNKRHQCPYCRLSWCSRCIPNHLLKEAKESRVKEAALKKKQPKKPFNSNPLAVGVVVDSVQVPAENIKVVNQRGRQLRPKKAPSDDGEALPAIARGRGLPPRPSVSTGDNATTEETEPDREVSQSTSQAPCTDDTHDKPPEGKEGPGFEILCRLGEGSYGAVYKAKDKRDGKTVAIKVIEDQAENLDSLYKEIEFLEGCSHDHIVAYKGTYQMMGQTCIAMEYCEGGSLNDIMEVCDRTFEEKEIAVIMRESLIGLHYLHSSHKIHRDVKSGNILVNELGECKLADFGVSCKVVDHDEKRKTIIGTPYWMAPEVLQAKEKGGYGCKSDIWSLGITAMELAKGVPPHSDMHPMRVIFKIPYVSPPKLPDPDNWSPEFMDFIAACLTKDQAARPTAEELLKHKFITDAGPVSLLADLVQRSMQEIDQYRKQEAVEAKKDEEMLRTAKDSVSETSESRTESRNDQFDSARMCGTTMLDDSIHEARDGDSQFSMALDTFESDASPAKPKPEKKKKEAVSFGTTQVSLEAAPDENSYLDRGSSQSAAPPSPATQTLVPPKKTYTISDLRQFGTTLLEAGLSEHAQDSYLADADSYLAQVQNAAKAKYEAEEEAAKAATTVPQVIARAGDWDIIRDPMGRVYYSNTKTHTTTWEQPADLDGAAAEIAYALNLVREKSLPTIDDADSTPPVSPKTEDSSVGGEPAEGKE